MCEQQGRRAGRVDFDNLNGERRFSSSSAYFQSKLTNLLFVRELQRGPGASGTDVIAVAAHPGGSRTGLGHETPAGLSVACCTSSGR